MGGTSETASAWPFEDATPRQSSTTVGNWPLYVLWGLSFVATLIAVLNLWRLQDVRLSVVAYGVLLVASFGLLLFHRIRLVQATRRATGSGAVVGMRRLERISVAAVVIGSVANGIVIGQWLGALEVWFS